MKLVATLLTSACLATTGAAVAQDKKMADKPMTMKECQDYMDMAKKDAAKKDAKKESMCADMMKKDAMKKDEKKK